MVMIKVIPISLVGGLNLHILILSDFTIQHSKRIKSRKIKKGTYGFLRLNNMDYFIK